MTGHWHHDDCPLEHPTLLDAVEHRKHIMLEWWSERRKHPLVNEADLLHISPDENPSEWFDHAFRPAPLSLADLPPFIQQRMKDKNLIVVEWPDFCA